MHLITIAREIQISGQKREDTSRTPAQGRSLGEAARRIRLTEAVTPEAPRNLSMEVEEETHTKVASNSGEGSNKADASSKEGLIASLNDAAGAVSEQEEARNHQDKWKRHHKERRRRQYRNSRTTVGK